MIKIINHFQLYLGRFSVALKRM